jgi:hypothetical protein
MENLFCHSSFRGSRFAFYSPYAKLNEIDVMARTFRSSRRVYEFSH